MPAVPQTLRQALGGARSIGHNPCHQGASDECITARWLDVWWTKGFWGTEEAPSYPAFSHGFSGMRWMHRDKYLVCSFLKGIGTILNWTPHRCVGGAGTESWERGWERGWGGGLTKIKDFIPSKDKLFHGFIKQKWLCSGKWAVILGPDFPNSFVTFLLITSQRIYALWIHVHAMKPTDTFISFDFKVALFVSGISDAKGSHDFPGYSWHWLPWLLLISLGTESLSAFSHPV